MKRLSDFLVGEVGIVKKVNGERMIRRRLFDMGITPGAEIYMRKKAPLGDPIEITIRVLVACGKMVFFKSSFSIPQPSSITSIDLIPPPEIITVICCAPASILFSTNSLTIDAGFSTTSPADNLL